MVKILGLLVVCVLLFVGGLGAALLLQPGSEDGASPDGKEGEAGKMAAAPEAPGGKSLEMPVAFHNRPMSTDDVFRLTASIRGRERDLKRREEKLEQKETRLKMVEEDLRGQRRELDGLMQQAQDTMENAMMTLQETEAARTELQKEQATANRAMDQAKKLQTDIDANESSNLSQISEILSQMPEAQGAAYLTKLANSGQMDMAVRLLQKMEGRTAAKFLSAIEDTALVVQITSEFRKHQRPKRN